MHQHAPDAFLAHLIALTRPGGRVAVQEYDLDGLPCFPAFGSFERMIDAGLIAIKHVGSDPYAGRKLLDRFTHAGLGDVSSFRPAYGSDPTDRKSTRLNSSHVAISYAVF